MPLRRGRLYRLTQSCWAGKPDPWNDEPDASAERRGEYAEFLGGVYGRVPGAYPRLTDLDKNPYRRPGMLNFYIQDADAVALEVPQGPDLRWLYVGLKTLWLEECQFSGG